MFSHWRQFDTMDHRWSVDHQSEITALVWRVETVILKGFLENLPTPVQSD